MTCADCKHRIGSRAPGSYGSCPFYKTYVFPADSKCPHGDNYWEEMMSETQIPISARLRAIGIELGNLVADKNAAYGSSFHQTGQFLELLYPNGIPKAQYQNALSIARIYDKLQRIASNQDAFGEDPWADIAGYGILGTDIARLRKQDE